MSIEEIYDGLSRLIVVGVALDRNQDNPQLIFESLNSTGLDLSQADLVRNFVLMGLEPAEQTELYQDHWRPMEELLGTGERSECFDAFLRAWLTLRTFEVPNKKEGYEAFKRYRSAHAQQPIYELVSDLHTVARYYARIVLRRETNPRLATVWQALQALRIDAPVPFLLFAIELEESGQISADELVQVAEVIESWVLRRSICDVPSNALSRTFATLPKHLDVTALADSLGAWLLRRRGRQVFPSDSEFRRCLVTRDLYRHRVCQHLLTRLENHGRKEPIAAGEYTIEHVIPQSENLAEEWRRMLGSDWQGVQERCLHTLGNLTLTGYNPELSNRPFQTKQAMEGGFKDSPLRLNHALAIADTWNEEAVLERARGLADKTLEIWPTPRPSEGMLVHYDPRGRTEAAAETADEEALSLHFEDALSALYDVLEGGLTDLGYTPLKQRSQISFQRPGCHYSPCAACWPHQGKLRIHLRDELAATDCIPLWFEAYRTGKGAARIRVDASTPNHVDAVVQHIAALTSAESGSEPH